MHTFRLRLLAIAGLVCTIQVAKPAPQKPAATEEVKPAEAKVVPYWKKPALKKNAFGKMIEENRWFLKRDKIVEYHGKITQNPAALLSLLGSFNPDRDKTNRIQGYTLKFIGEQDFLTSMTLQDGDTIRTVNSMTMNSQERANWFISETVKGKINAIVIELERKGKLLPLVYIVR